MNQFNSELIFTILGGSLILILLLIFIISFFFVYQRRQIQNQLEKVALKAQFDQEILNAQNEIQEITMKEISQELHDNVCHSLTLVKIQLNNLSDDIKDNPKIDDAKMFIKSALTDIRLLSKSLNNDNFMKLGLINAINSEIDRIRKLGIIKVSFNESYTFQKLEAKQEVLVFRIFQELLQNILKHANAKNIKINLVETQQNFNLAVIDDGIGFDYELKINQINSGIGLNNLQYRAKLLNGAIIYDKNQTGGTKVNLTILY